VEPRYQNGLGNDPKNKSPIEPLRVFAQFIGMVFGTTLTIYAEEKPIFHSNDYLACRLGQCRRDHA